MQFSHWAFLEWCRSALMLLAVSPDIVKTVQWMATWIWLAQAICIWYCSKRECNARMDGCNFGNKVKLLTTPTSYMHLTTCCAFALSQKQVRMCAGGNFQTTGQNRMQTSLYSWYPAFCSPLQTNSPLRPVQTVFFSSSSSCGVFSFSCGVLDGLSRAHLDLSVFRSSKLAIF